MTTASPDDGVVRGVVAIGASAGGVEALKRLAAGLSPEMPYAVLVALHMAAGSPSVLAQIIDRNGPLPATQAVDGEPLRPGHVYVSTPDRHLLVRDHHAVVTRGPAEVGHRPAIDPLLRSAAVAYGPRAIGVLLSGVLSDGVLGLTAIRARGGVTVVQDPDDALFPDLPRNAIAAGVVDHEVAASAAGRLLEALAALPDENVAAATGVTPPDGSGPSVAVADHRDRGGRTRAFEALFEERTEETENALRIALLGLEERAELARTHEAGLASGALRRRYGDIARESDSAARVLRDRLAEAEADPETR